MPDSRWKLVSIRTLCGEGDGRRGKAERHQFQHFYPRPPQGGRPTIRRWTMPSGQFLSTPSARRATCAVTAFRKQLQIISIHALREEGDRPQAQVQSKADNFYPRPPRGGRRSAPSGRRSNSAFLSTPSARRATRLCVDVVHHGVAISIHALREEGDAAAARATARPANFYPRPPRGGRRILPCFFPPKIIFLSTPSARRATRYQGTLTKNTKFLSTPSARRATKAAQALRQAHTISIHALREEGDVIRTKSMLPV